MLNVVLNAELGECGARMWNCMAFNSAWPAGFILVEVSVYSIYLSRKIYSYVSNICETDAAPIS